MQYFLQAMLLAKPCRDSTEGIMRLLTAPKFVSCH